MKQTIEKDIKFSRLSENENFYIYIFKKTEKIIGAVFYVCKNVSDKDTDASLLEELRAAAKHAHSISLESLHHFEHAADEILMKYAHALIALESTARLCTAAGLISSDIMNVLAAEIDAVHRGLQNRYMVGGAKVVFGDAGVVATTSAPAPAAVGDGTTARRTTASSTPRSASSSPAAPPSHTADRRTRIRAVLEAKGESTIKDISAVVTDVSEKTIQRELNAMIEDNTIRRIGERRWSKYTIK